MRIKAFKNGMKSLRLRVFFSPEPLARYVGSACAREKQRPGAEKNINREVVRGRPGTASSLARR